MSIFNQIQVRKPATNRFDLTHDLKFSFKMGRLIPTNVIECLPGDSFTIQAQNMLRMLPMVSPVMHKINVTTHHYFVPTRLLWSGWEDWITGNSDVEAPYITIGLDEENNYAEIGSLADYLGYATVEYDNDPESPTYGDPIPTPQPYRVSPMQMAAYLLICDEHYRDQNLVAESFKPLVNGANDLEYNRWLALPPLKRAWEHDYFTSCLPFAQKGDAVTLPLTFQENIPVELDPNYDGPSVQAKWADGSGTAAANANWVHANGPSPLDRSLHVNGVPSVIDPNGSLTVDVQSDAVDINTVRRAFKLQEWLEKNARGGTRYIESIWAHFFKKSSDARLQRPEYLGGAVQNMTISEVLATAQDSGDEPVAVGQMAGHGISVGGSRPLRYTCEEHGFIITIINVQPQTAYQQGIHRSFTRFNRLDYAWPTFANLGEQEVLQKEIKASVTVGGPNPLTPDSIFGYQSRYAEYKYLNSRVASQMKRQLAHWTMARIFEDNPRLNSLFVTADPTTRIFAVTDEDEDHIVAHVFNVIKVVRRLPRYGIPTI